MPKNIDTYIAAQSVDRRDILAGIHAIIVQHDQTIEPVVEPMMGKEMILYKSKGMMKYGLAGVKNYMSLHVLPIYASKPLYEKYHGLLPKANFQKGCINFKNEEELPLEVVRQLMTDCAKIDLAKIREDYIKQKQSKHGRQPNS